MNKTAVLIIILVCLLGFFNALGNGFVGDDQFIFLQNDFYSSLDNLPKLLTDEYLTDSSTFFSYYDRQSSSGSVAYRPVLSLTYFIDYFVWQLNPFGYHLTNVAIHLVNSLLVYALILLLLKCDVTALIGALLFCVHPTKTEAVCAIGYRADVLSALFVLSSFILFVKYRRGGGQNLGLAGLSLSFFFLALFTKEIAVVTPLLMFAYDRIFSPGNLKEHIKNSVSFYFSLALILLFYLYVYFFVFVNTSLVKLDWIGGNLGVHFLTAVWIFCQYLVQLGLPFTVNVLPALYAPDVQSLLTLNMIVMICCLGAFSYLFIVLKRKKGPVFFGLLWFMICYLPVSNLVRIANPMAHRFLYLPSVGLALVAAYFLNRLRVRVSASKNSKLGNIIVVTIIAVCLCCTIPLNYYWNNNVAIAKSWVDNYPQHQKGHIVLGTEFFKARMFPEAKEALSNAERLNTGDPRVYYMLGIILEDQPGLAEQYFFKAINLHNFYVAPYVGLGRLNFIQGNYERAIHYLKQGMQIRATFPGYGMMIDSYLKLNDINGAKQALAEAKQSDLKDYCKASLEHKLKVGTDTTF